MMQQPMLKKVMKRLHLGAIEARCKSGKIFRKVRWDIVNSDHEQPPTDGSSQQCTGRLVDVKRVLKSDEKVAQDKDGEYDEFHE